MKEITHACGRFGVTGIICTFISYFVFVIASYFVQYIIANIISWLVSVAFAFPMHRGFTFKERADLSWVNEIGRFIPGSVGQLILASFGYWVLIGQLGLLPVVAFPLNLLITATAMFLYLHFVVFRG